MISDSSLKSIAGKSLVFYNVENLYDTINDPAVDDDDFTPLGFKHWNIQKYFKKIDQISKVLSQVGPTLPIFIGLSEVENKRVLLDLVSSKYLASRMYKIIHRESPDRRGADVAFLFDEQYFNCLGFDVIEIPLLNEQGEQDFTRDILHVYGNLCNDIPIHFYINHWPSRREGVELSEEKRCKAAEKLKAHIHEVLEGNENSYVIVMGDFNDEPDDKSLVQGLESVGVLGELTHKNLFNLHHRYYLEKKGSVAHKGIWKMYDQILVNKNCLFWDNPLVNMYSGKILHKKWMMYKDKKSGALFPNKTYSGDKYHQGYSDHLPVYINFEPVC